LRARTGGFEHEVRPATAELFSSLINQITLTGFCPNVDRYSILLDYIRHDCTFFLISFSIHIRVEKFNTKKPAMDLGLAGKRALVTGGSRGIGRAIAAALIAEGAKVAISARGADGLAEAAAALPGVRTDVVDSADYAGVAAWVNTVATDWGGLDIVISNVSAGGGVPLGLEGWQQATQTDIVGTAALVEAALPHLRESKGAIVQIATITAIEHHDFPGSPAYGAVKAALVRYMGELAIREGQHGVRANTVSPGPIWVDGGVWEWVRDNMRPWYDRDIEAHPQKRLGSAEEVARVAVFLASPAAGWVSGQNVCVDGAFTRGIKF
jgi:3-oxoacyl-[acyl-carrier protein] reductase